MRDAVKLSESYQAFLPVGGNREAEQKAALAVPLANTRAWQENGETMKMTERFLSTFQQSRRWHRCNINTTGALGET